MVEPQDSIFETTEKYKIAQDYIFRSVRGVVEPLDPMFETVV